MSFAFTLITSNITSRFTSLLLRRHGIDMSFVTIYYKYIIFSNKVFFAYSKSTHSITWNGILYLVITICN